MLQVRMLTTYAASLREEAEQGTPPPRVTYADDTGGAADLGSPVRETGRVVDDGIVRRAAGRKPSLNAFQIGRQLGQMDGGGRMPFAVFDATGHEVSGLPHHVDQRRAL